MKSSILAFSLSALVTLAFGQDNRMTIRSFQNPDCEGSGGALRIKGDTEGCLTLLPSTNCIIFSHGNAQVFSDANCTPEDRVYDSGADLFTDTVKAKDHGGAIGSVYYHAGVPTSE